MNKPFKLLVTDLDGTLLNPQSEIPVPNIRALQGWVDNGGHLALATGRNITITEPIAAAIQRPMHLILQDGALVINYPHKQILTYHNLMPAALQAALDIFAGAGIAVMAFDPLPHGRRFTLCPFGEPSAGLNAYLAKNNYGQKTSVARLPTVASKLVTLHNKASINKVVGQLQTIPETRVMITGAGRMPGYFLEIGSPQAAKLNGLQTVMSRLKLTDWQVVIAIGDAENDREMLSAVGRGVAMGNAAPQVKKAANEIIGSNAGNALAKFVNSLK